MAAALTELDVIEQIRRQFSGASRRVVLGIGDDCAVLRPPRGHDLLVTTDFTLEGRHFRRDTHSPESAGHRTLARGLSDLAAMGGTPLAAFLSLALPRALLKTRAGRQWMERFLGGVHSLAEVHKVTLAGGDTAESPSTGVLADIVLTGTVPRGRALRRSTAQVGDLIYVTGALGGAAAELQGLFAGAEAKRQLREAAGVGENPQLFPEPRLAVGQALLRRGLVTACMDLSDGLSTDLTHLCRASKLRAEIEEGALPLHALARYRADAVKLALHGGEDYELMFTAGPGMRVPSRIAGVAVTRIGRMQALGGGLPGVTMLLADGGRRPVKPAGWEHFAA